MLFLITDIIKIEFVKPGVALAEIAMLKQTFQIYEDLKNKNKIKFVYAFADNPGAIVLLDVESNEELQRILFLLPSMPVVQRTVKPLTEMKSVLEIVDRLDSIVGSMPKDFDTST